MTNARIAEYPAPIVVFADGITMGGGIGLAGHAAVRVVTERSKLAMPETRIGFTPDVGGTWLLGRAPGRLGEYLALTGAGMDAADAMYAGFADHLRRCDGVITSAGSNVLAECVMLRKPALALYRRGDAEQALNARLAEHAGVALARSFEELRPGDIADFLARVRGGEFAAPDLVTAMPPVSEVVVSAVAALLV